MMMPFLRKVYLFSFFCTCGGREREREGERERGRERESERSAVAQHAGYARSPESWLQLLLSLLFDYICTEGS
jgi:hypothetical protein